MPARRRLPPDVPLPRRGDVLVLAPGSAWAVQLVVWDMPIGRDLCVEVWLEHVADMDRAALSTISTR